jgi:hypothetical protein
MLKLLLLSMTLVTGPAWGSIAFSNFGGGDAYDTGEKWAVYSGQFLAVSFTPSVTGTLSSVRVALSAVSVAVQPLHINLTAPAADPNGAFLEGWDLSPSVVATDPSSSIETLTSFANPLLTSGLTYWLSMESADGPGSGFGFRWFRNSQGQNGFAASENGGSSWAAVSAATPVLEVNVEPLASVPEPSTLAMAMLSVVLLIWLGRRDSNPDTQIQSLQSYR